MNATTGARLFSKHANGDMQSVKVVNGIVWCGGHYGGTGGFDGLVRYKIAGVSATAPYATLAFAPFVDSALGVWALGADADPPLPRWRLRQRRRRGDPALRRVHRHHRPDAAHGSGADRNPGRHRRAPGLGPAVDRRWPDDQELRRSRRRVSGVGAYVKIATVRGPVTYDDTAVVNNTAYDYTVIRDQRARQRPGLQRRDGDADPVHPEPANPAAELHGHRRHGQRRALLGRHRPTTATRRSPATPSTAARAGRRDGVQDARVLDDPVLHRHRTSQPGRPTTTTSPRPTPSVRAGLHAELSATPTAGVPGPTTLSATTDPGVVHLSWTIGRLRRRRSGHQVRRGARHRPAGHPERGQHALLRRHGGRLRARPTPTRSAPSTRSARAASPTSSPSRSPKS